MLLVSKDNSRIQDAFIGLSEDERTVVEQGVYRHADRQTTMDRMAL